MSDPSNSSTDEGNAAEQMEERFCIAWEEAVSKLPSTFTKYFVDRQRGARSRIWKLCPSIRLITAERHYMSTGEIRYLAILCCFYNGLEGQALLTELGVGFTDAFSNLDYNRQIAVLKLLKAYCGW